MPEQGAELSVLEGTVSSLIFQNEENGYTILRLDVGEEEMTVVGSMPGCPRGVPHCPGAVGAPRHLRRPVSGGCGGAPPPRG